VKTTGVLTKNSNRASVRGGIRYRSGIELGNVQRQVLLLTLWGISRPIDIAPGWAARSGCNWWPRAARTVAPMRS
jgi:hypothetical protein